MKFSEVVGQAIQLLQSRGRVTYRVLKREFALDDEALEDLKEQLIEAEGLAVDQDGKMLVWKGAAVAQALGTQPSRASEPSPASSDANSATDNSRAPRVDTAERRQLTVMFCDLVGSTALSAQLDPEDYRTVVQQYHHTCDAVIQRYDGFVSQHLGDGLLVYFGYPTAHEDDAQRAVRAGTEILSALTTLSPSSPGAKGLPARIGIHTGLVVVGDIGAPGRTEQLALGETPNIAARIQGLAEPNTMIVSAATHRLVQDAFECQPFGSQLVKGIDTPIAVYHVQSERQQVSPLAGRRTLTPLVGREQEVGLLLERWEQVKEGRGHVVLLSGEPGIGKSRLAYQLREHVTAEGSLLYEARCSPYHQQSALYPLIDLLQRTLLFTRQDADDEKVAKLAQALALYELQDALPFLTVLLSLPTPTESPPLTLTPQKQKERTLYALVQLLTVQAERQATVVVWEDVHWADPSSLEFLSLLIDQIPTTKLLLVLTFRPEFTPPWPLRSHLSHLVLHRLGQGQVEEMIEQAAAGHDLPAAVIEQIRVKTDGVPLFVEELTKSVVEHLEQQVPGNEQQGRQPGAGLGIPATLQHALMARLDRLSEARPLVQLGATLGREFSYELLRTVALLSEAQLQAALSKLVEAGILYQRGVGEQARYFFKHALIQDTAYQSLLKSTRQRYHQHIAQVLAEYFPETKATQPELLAHHYTEAGLSEQAIPYWQQAGQWASERSANAEAIAHLRKGLELLKELPDTPARTQQELLLQATIGPALMATQGWAAPEVGQSYTRAHELCRRVGSTPQLFAALWGLWQFTVSRAEHQAARELGEQLLKLGQEGQDSALLLNAHFTVGLTFFWMGEFARAEEHVEQGLALYQLQPYRAHTFLYEQDAGVGSLIYAAWSLWMLGYPEQALKKSQAALTLAQTLAHSFSLAVAQGGVTLVRQFRREVQAAREWAETNIALSTEHGFAFWVTWEAILRGWTMVEQGQGEEGIEQMGQGLAAYRATGAEIIRPYNLALLAEGYRKVERVEKGLTLLNEALGAVDTTGERMWEAELYRLKGELTLQLQGASPKAQVAEAEAYFLKAIDIACRQQAKSLELRASMSLARLWRQQGKKDEARQLLAEIYGWFTEGFDTKDLQEAKTLLGELVEGS